MKKDLKNNLKIGDKFKYNSAAIGIDSFIFTVFQINITNVDIIVNNGTYTKIPLSEFSNSNLSKI